MKQDRRPFLGVQVLDVTRVAASPFAAYQLALLGAEVIKIEDPRSKGDTMRFRKGTKPEYGRNGMATYFMAQAANKKSLALDLRTEAGQGVFRNLARNADVVIENLKTGAMDRYGLGYEDLSRINPRLIYCSLTGYGQTGPMRAYPAYDPVIQAASGMMSVNGTPETSPVKLSAPVVGYGSGLAAALGTVSALFERERSGLGQHVDVSMLDTALVLMSALVCEAATAGSTPAAHGNASLAESYCNVCLPCSEGMIAIAAMEQHQRLRMWTVIERPDIPSDPRFATDEDCRRNVKELHREMSAAFAKRNAQEWEDLLNRAGVPAMRVRTIPEALAMDQVRERGVLHHFPELPGIEGGATVPMVPFSLSASGPRMDSPPPLLGQHTDELLSACGYSPEAIAGLRAAGAVL